MAKQRPPIMGADRGVDYKAYSAARSILRKRLERLVAKFPDNTRAVSILRMLKTKMTTKDVRAMNDDAKARAVSKIEGWLTVGSLSLTGVRAQTVKALATMAEHGYTGLTADDLYKWGKAAKLAQAAAASKLLKYETALASIRSQPEDIMDASLNELNKIHDSKIPDAQSKAESKAILEKLIKLIKDGE
nr:MAG TPA: hypothetical protein [Caudoviricetes sp.]